MALSKSRKHQVSIRLVDLSLPVNRNVGGIRQATSKQSGDILFASRMVRPVSPTTLRKYGLIPLGIPGLHSLRRWRVSYSQVHRHPLNLC